MVHKMTDFVTCPFCAGHEKVSDEASAFILQAIAYEMGERGSELSPDLITELLNIRNAILNTAERAAPVEEYTPPKCPTPQKQRFYSRGATEQTAKRWGHHPYECVCGYWHLSKQTPAAHVAKLNAPSASGEEFETIPIDPLLL